MRLEWLKMASNGSEWLGFQVGHVHPPIVLLPEQCRGGHRTLALGYTLGAPLSSGFTTQFRALEPGSDAF